MRLERKFDCWIGSGVVRSGSGPGAGGAGGGRGEEGEFRLPVVKPRELGRVRLGLLMTSRSSSSFTRT